MIVKIGRDRTGILAVDDGGMVFYLTDCCEASAKGSTTSPTGVCCRACYEAIDPAMGNAWIGKDAIIKVASITGGGV